MAHRLQAVLAPLACAAALALVAGSAHAETFSFSLANVASHGVEGNTDNLRLSFFLGESARITGFSWDVQVTAFEPSWLSELSLAVGNSSGEGFYFNPIDAVDTPGTQSAAGSANLVNLGVGFTLRPDGLLVLEFHEAFDDIEDAPDGIWDRASFSFDYTPAVPEPQTWALWTLGLVGAAFVSRRRRSD